MHDHTVHTVDVDESERTESADRPELVAGPTAADGRTAAWPVRGGGWDANTNEPVLVAAWPRGGWDGNSNEPLLVAR